MREADGVVIFKEWLPDVAPLDNQGLVEALNTLPVDGTYKSFPSLTAAGTPSSTPPLGAIEAVYGGSGVVTYYGATTTTHRSTASSWQDISSTAYATSTFWQFAQFENLVIAVNGAVNFPQQHTIGSASNMTALATSGTAPPASCIGIINKFVIVGNLGVDTSTIQWSAIDQPNNWPTPLSATATATQSGSQIFDGQYGPVTGISGGDQYGVVFQTGATYRMTYVGPPVVFQFDQIDQPIGCAFPNSIVRAGGLHYFANYNGFFVTDGVRITSIGAGKVDRFFAGLVDTGALVTKLYGAVDISKKLIYWGFPDTSATNDRVNNILLYNYEEKRWARATTAECLVLFPAAPASSSATQVRAFASGNTLGRLNGQGTTAIFTTGEAEFVRGGRTFVQGIKPNVDATVNAVTVAIGTRNDQATTPTFTSEVTATSRTGVCDFRQDGKYHRARITVSGTFNSAQGFEPLIDPSGAT